MTSVSKDPIALANADFDRLKADVASLRSDMFKLATHLQSGAVTGLSNAARRHYDRLATDAGRSIDVVQKQVEAQPVISLLLAVAAGFIGGRLLGR